MPSLDKVTLNQAPIRMVVYGQPKTRKTAVVAELANQGYTLHILQCENSVDTLLNPLVVKPENRKNIILYNIPDTQETPIACATVTQVLSGIPTKICDEHGKHNCPTCKENIQLLDLKSFTSKDILVIDSITQVADSIRNNLCGAIFRADGKLGFDEYRKEGLYLSRIFLRMQNFPVNLVTIAHEDLVELEDGTKKLVPSSGTKNFAKGVAGYFTTVVHCSYANGKFKVATSSEDDRLGISCAANGHRLKEGESLAKLFHSTLS